jgi:hypothetical protein
MARSKAPIWSEFGEPFLSADARSKKVKCKHCTKLVAAAAARMEEHHAACKRVPRGVGFLPVGVPQRAIGKSATISGSSSGGANQVATSSSFRLARAWCDSMNMDEAAELDSLYARAVLRGGNPFAMHDTAEWSDFFTKLRGCYKRPTADRLAGDLLRKEYATFMNEAVVKMQQWQVQPYVHRMSR